MFSSGRNLFSKPEEHPGTGNLSSAAHHTPTSRASVVAGAPEPADAHLAQGAEQNTDRAHFTSGAGATPRPAGTLRCDQETLQSIGEATSYLESIGRKGTTTHIVLVTVRSSADCKGVRLLTSGDMWASVTNIPSTTAADILEAISISTGPVEMVGKVMAALQSAGISEGLTADPAAPPPASGGRAAGYSPFHSPSLEVSSPLETAQNMRALLNGSRPSWFQPPCKEPSGQAFHLPVLAEVVAQAPLDKDDIGSGNRTPGITLRECIESVWQPSSCLEWGPRRATLLSTMLEVLAAAVFTALRTGLSEDAALAMGHSRLASALSGAARSIKSPEREFSAGLLEFDERTDHERRVGSLVAVLDNIAHRFANQAHDFWDTRALKMGESFSDLFADVHLMGSRRGEKFENVVRKLKVVLGAAMKAHPDSVDAIVLASTTFELLASQHPEMASLHRVIYSNIALQRVLVSSSRSAQDDNADTLATFPSGKPRAPMVDLDLLWASADAAGLNFGDPPPRALKLADGSNRPCVCKVCWFFKHKLVVWDPAYKLLPGERFEHNEWTCREIPRFVDELLKLLPGKTKDDVYRTLERRV